VVDKENGPARGLLRKGTQIKIVFGGGGEPRRKRKNLERNYKDRTKVLLQEKKRERIKNRF